MAKKIQDIGIGKYIRSPRGRRQSDSRGMAIEVLKIVTDNGNSFTCYPVSSVNSGSANINTDRYYNIPIDSMVEEASI